MQPDWEKAIWNCVGRARRMEYRTSYQSKYVQFSKKYKHELKIWHNKIVHFLRVFIRSGEISQMRRMVWYGYGECQQYFDDGHKNDILIKVCWNKRVSREKKCGGMGCGGRYMHMQAVLAVEWNSEQTNCFVRKSKRMVLAQRTCCFQFDQPVESPFRCGNS